MRNVSFLPVVMGLLLACLNTGGCESPPPALRIGIIQWTERVEPFNHTFRGVIDGLRDRGYREKVNMELLTRNAEQSKEAVLAIARAFADRNVDLIVALGTGSSLAALKATENKKIPIVFSIVGAPKATGVVGCEEGANRRITGVSMKVPIEEQFGSIPIQEPSRSLLSFNINKARQLGIEIGRNCILRADRVFE